MIRKKISFIAIGPSSSISLSFNEITKISPVALVEIFNSFTKIPINNNNSLVVAGSLADKVDIDQDQINTMNSFKKVLAKSGFSNHQVDRIETDLIHGKTVVVEA